MINKFIASTLLCVGILSLSGPSSYAMQVSERTAEIKGNLEQALKSCNTALCSTWSQRVGFGGASLFGGSSDRSDVTCLKNISSQLDSAFAGNASLGTGWSECQKLWNPSSVDTAFLPGLKTDISNARGRYSFTQFWISLFGGNKPLFLRISRFLLNMPEAVKPAFPSFLGSDEISSDLTQISKEAR